MIYVIDSKTGDEIAQVSGDVLKVADSFLRERTRDGVECSLVKKGYGYLLCERNANGRLKPLVEIRTKPRVKYAWICVKFAGLLLVAVTGSLLFFAFKELDRCLGLDKPKRRQLRNPFF